MTNNKVSATVAMALIGGGTYLMTQEYNKAVQNKEFHLTNLHRLVKIDEDIAKLADIDMDQAFSVYCSQFGKAYYTREEYDLRKANFIKNIQDIQGYNKVVQNKIANSSDTLDYNDFVELGINEMIDWTDDERKNKTSDMGDFYIRNKDYIDN